MYIYICTHWHKKYWKDWSTTFMLQFDCNTGMILMLRLFIIFVGLIQQFCMEFACSLHVCTGFLQVLQSFPQPKICSWSATQLSNTMQGRPPQPAMNMMDAQDLLTPPTCNLTPTSGYSSADCCTSANPVSRVQPEQRRPLWE